MKEYTHRNDGRKLDQLGAYYMRHVSAMTGECLHSKSDIAAELAWRDSEIDRLSALISKLDAQLSARPCQAGRCAGFAELRAKAEVMDAALADLLDGENPDSLHYSTGLGLDRCRQLCALKSLNSNSA